ncbi:MAG: dihydrolipoyl dehydrogenase [Candidatus Omnitrophota bacterium]
MTKYDLAIIGSGPGGYIAAIYASRHKLKTCVIEKDLIGGTCLNRGCIPTKSLLASASVLSTIKESRLHGIETGACKVDFSRMVSRKDEIVKRLRTGVETLFRANSIALVKGAAAIDSPDTLKVDGAGEISAKNIIIASGAKPAAPANVKFDGHDILSSDDILDIRSIPKSLVIIGGGVIGCEFAGLYNSLGSRVAIIEYTDRLIPAQSREVSKKLELSFRRRGIDIFTSSAVESIAKRPGSLMITLSGARPLETEKILVSVGRTPVTGSIGDLAALGIETITGRIVVDEYLRTHLKNIYAIGDCIDGPLLAHKASYDGVIAVDNILGKMRRPDYSNVPSCIWTEPQIASVGMREEDAKAAFPDVKIAKFPYLGCGKAALMGQGEGFAKVIGDPRGRILGLEIFGAGACELIAEGVLARTADLGIEEWSRVVHGHPTLSEIWQEAARAFCDIPIHGV